VVRRENQDPRGGIGQEIEHVGIEARPEVENGVGRRQLVDRPDEADAMRVGEIGELLDGVLRRGDEGEVLEVPVGVELFRESGEAALERFSLPEEVIEVALDRGIHGVADRRRAGVEVDEHGRGHAREGQGKVERKGALADAALPGRDRDDPANSHAVAG